MKNIIALPDNPCDHQNSHRLNAQLLLLQNPEGDSYISFDLICMNLTAFYDNL